MSSEIARVTLADSLTKVTPSWTPTPHLSELSGWHGETVSFQVAWRPRRTMPTRLRTTLRVQVEGAGEVTFFAVDLVPAQLPCFDEAGDGYIATEASMLPDVLRPLEVSASGTVEATPTHIGWHSVWVDVPLPAPTCGYGPGSTMSCIWMRRWRWQSCLVPSNPRRSASPSGSTAISWLHTMGSRCGARICGPPSSRRWPPRREWA